MKRAKLSILISFCLIFISLISFGKKEEMKLILFKGDHFTYLISQENSVQERDEPSRMNQKVSLRITHNVVDRLSGGDYLMEATIDGFSTEFKNEGRKYKYNSDTVDVRNKLYKSLIFLNDIKISYQVSPEGVVSNIKGFEPIKNRTDADPFLKSMLFTFGNEQFILDFFNYLPLDNVKVGSKWKNSSSMYEFDNFKYNIQHSFKAETEKEIKLAHEAAFKYSTELSGSNSITRHVTQNVTQQGTIVIHPKNKMPLSTELIQKIELSAYVDGAITRKLNPAVFTTKTKMTRVKK